MATALQTRQAEVRTWRDPKSFLKLDVWEREIKLLARDNPRSTASSVSSAAASWCTAVHAFILDTRNYPPSAVRVHRAWTPSEAAPLTA